MSDDKLKFCGQSTSHGASLFVYSDDGEPPQRLVPVASQPFNGPADLLADEQAKLRDAPLADLERWAAERTHVFAGAGYRTVRAQAATAEIARRGLTKLCAYDDEAVLRAVEASIADRGCAAGDAVGWSERAREEFAGSIVGDVMCATKGRANPTQVKSVALAVLRGEDG